MKKYFALFSFLGLCFGSIASAHVVVRPQTVGVGAFQTFTVSVPSEKDVATSKIRLTLPMGLEYLTPTVKPGWKVEVVNHKMDGEDHPAEIVWSGGSIPGHFRDDFTFSARVPSTSTTLSWKAYQTYADGSVVSWELDPKDSQPQKEDGSPDFSKLGPFSQTEVVDDLTSSAQPEQDLSVPLSFTALLLSLTALWVSMKRKR